MAKKQEAVIETPVVNEFAAALTEPREVPTEALSFTPKRTGVITVPQLHWSDGETLYIKIETAFGLSDFEGTTERKAATIARVTNLRDMQYYTLIINAVFQKELEKTYPNGGYVGKCFEATKSQEKKAGKSGNYSTFTIYPIEDPTK